VKSKSAEEQLLEVLAMIFETDVNELSRATNLSEDLHANSLKLFMTAAQMSEIAGTEVTYGQLKECPTVGDAIDLIERLQ
jgi:acyl carrier protein